MKKKEELEGRLIINGLFDKEYVDSVITEFIVNINNERKDTGTH